MHRIKKTSIEGNIMKKDHWDENTEKRYWESIACACANVDSMEDVPRFLVNDIASEYMLEPMEVIDDCLDCIRSLRISKEISAGHEVHHETVSPLSKSEIAKITGGYVFTVDEFIEDVRQGCIMDYDGFGCFVSGDGSEELDIFVDIEWLDEFRDEWPYVSWFNK